MAVTPGIDVSKHQGKIDWARVSGAGYRFAYVRATMGVTGVDTRFAINWEGSKAAGILTSSYHLIRPEHPGEPQTAHFLRTLGDRVADLPLALDVELDGSDRTLPIPLPAQSREAIAECVRSAAILLERETGRKPILYTARWFWNRAVAPSREWEAYDLWVAHYGVATPTIPDPWTRWTMWQHSATGSVPGVPGECDLNYFDGDLDALRRYGIAAVEPPPVNALPPRARVIAQTLNVRSGADSTFPAIDKLRAGQVVPILNLDGREVWVKIGEGKWAALAFRGNKYMNIVTHPDQLKARVVAQGLNIRTGPNMNYADIGDLHQGDEVSIGEIDGNAVWVEFAPGKWSALSLSGKRFMEVK